MNPFKTAWQLLWSLPTAVAAVVLMLCMLAGFGSKQLDRFIIAWNGSMPSDD